MIGLMRPRSLGRRIGRIGAFASVLLVFCAAAALAAPSHSAKRASAPANTAGLSAHVVSPALGGGRAALGPAASGGALPAAGTSSPIGAGHLSPFLRLVSASVSFTAPSITCHSGSDQEWLLPGIWILDSSGNLVSQIDVNLNCNSGSKFMADVICISGGSCDSGTVQVNAGDKIEVTYVQTDSSATGEVTDHTTHAAAQASGSPQVNGSYVFEGDFGPGLFGVGGVPTFIKVPFTIATINGFYIGDWATSTLNLKTGSDVQIKSGSAATTSFTTKFVTNY